MISSENPNLNGILKALQKQRDDALEQVVLLSGELAEAKDQIEKLQPKQEVV